MSELENDFEKWSAEVEHDFEKWSDQIELGYNNNDNEDEDEDRFKDDFEKWSDQIELGYNNNDNEDEDVVTENQVLTHNHEITPTPVFYEIDEPYNFDKATILISLQILPLIDKQARPVLITGGIKGEPPIISKTTLSEITQCAVLAEILEQLKQALPSLQSLAQKRQEKQQASQRPSSAPPGTEWA